MRKIFVASQYKETQNYWGLEDIVQMGGKKLDRAVGERIKRQLSEYVNPARPVSDEDIIRENLEVEIRAQAILTLKNFMMLLQKGSADLKDDPTAQTTVQRAVALFDRDPSVTYVS